MARNSELPSIPSLGTISSSDKVLVYDVSLQPNGERAMTVAELFEKYLATLPTSSAGLASGKLWKNSGVITQVS